LLGTRLRDVIQLILALPHTKMDNNNSCLIESSQFPYPIDCYGEHEENGIRTFKVIVDEMLDLIRRYTLVLPSTVEFFETDKYTGFRCMVNDDISGVTRGLLERLDFELQESEFTPYGLYWVTLKTRIDKGKRIG
jgi:hypothetical protein